MVSVYNINFSILLHILSKNSKQFVSTLNGIGIKISTITQNSTLLHRKKFFNVLSSCLKHVCSFYPLQLNYESVNLYIVYC